jgi:hypothetical protein
VTLDRPATVGDLLRAWDRLMPRNPDTERRLVELLAPELLLEASSSAPAREAAESTLGTVTGPEALPSPSLPASFAHGEEDAQPAETLPTDLVDETEPGGEIALSEPLPEPAREFEEPSLPSLLSPASSRALLSTLVSVTRAEGDLDLPRMIDCLSRGRPPREVPRLPVRRLRGSLHVLVDSGRAMEPFSRDQAQVIDQLDRVVGRSRFQVRAFERTPDQAYLVDAQAPGPQRSELPCPGTLVLVLSDLGTSRSAGSLASIGGFAAFGRLLRRNGCRPVALCPYPAARLSSAVRAAFDVVHWDRRTTAGAVARLLSRVKVS